MTYELLSKCFYKVPKKQYENECVIRKKSVSAVTLPVCINGNESFYVCTNEMILTLEEIYRKNLELTEKVNKLPEVDKTFCFTNVL